MALKFLRTLNYRVMYSLLTVNGLLTGFLKRTVTSFQWNQNPLKFSQNCKNENKLYEPNKMEHVSTFKDISLKQRSIVFCDIDDTVFDFGREVDDYWNAKLHDPQYDLWFEMIKRITPKLTCPHFYDFLSQIEKTNSTIYFITARNPRFREATERNMKHHNLDHITVHYLGGSSKGDYINSNFELNNYEGGSLFIDDSECNLHDVSNKVKKCKIHKFVKQNSE